MYNTREGIIEGEIHKEIQLLAKDSWTRCCWLIYTFYVFLLERGVKDN